MPWFKVDDGLSSKLETTRIPRAHRSAAIGLWTLAGSWSARELTDGHVPGHMIDELAGSAEDAQRLVDAGFWSIVEGGFQFVVWNGQQPMREKVEEARAKNAAKVKNWRSRNQVSNPVTNGGDTPVGDDDVTLPPTRTRPVPISDEIEKPSSPSARAITSAFERAYAAWPKKAERKRSIEAFTRVAKARGLETVTADVIRFGNAYAATTAKQFVPALCVWLNRERWDDDLPTSGPPSDAEWNSFINGAPPARVAQISRQEECDAGKHLWFRDGTCNFCSAKREPDLEGLLP